MTDDKGAGERGPYEIKNRHHWWHVDGLGEENRMNQWAYKMGAEWWANKLNAAYAEGRASVEKYTVEMLKFATDEVRKCHEQIRQLEEKYARNVYVMPPGKPSFDQKEHDVLVEKGTKAWGKE